MFVCLFVCVEQKFSVFFVGFFLHFLLPWLFQLDSCLARNYVDGNFNTQAQAHSIRQFYSAANCIWKNVANCKLQWFNVERKKIVQIFYVCVHKVQRKCSCSFHQKWNENFVHRRKKTRPHTQTHTRLKCTNNFRPLLMLSAGARYILLSLDVENVVSMMILQPTKVWQAFRVANFGRHFTLFATMQANMKNIVVGIFNSIYLQNMECVTFVKRAACTWANLLISRDSSRIAYKKGVCH